MGIFTSREEKNRLVEKSERKEGGLPRQHDQRGELRASLWEVRVEKKCAGITKVQWSFGSLYENTYVLGRDFFVRSTSTVGLNLKFVILNSFSPQVERYENEHKFSHLLPLFPSILLSLPWAFEWISHLYSIVERLHTRTIWILSSFLH